MGWRIVDWRNKVMDKAAFEQEAKEEQAEKERQERLKLEGKDINSAQNSPDKVAEKVEPKMTEQEKWLKDPNNWDIFWADSGTNAEFLSSLACWQKANHFLGMYNICRKSMLGIHLNRFKKEFPDHFGFFPHTWVYPADFSDI